MSLRVSYRLAGVPGVGKRRAELGNPAPCRHSAERTSSGRTHRPKEGDWDAAPRFSPPHCFMQGHRTPSRRGEAGGEERRGPGNSYISFFCVFPLQHSWQPKGLLCPWKESSCLSRQHNREKILGAWKVGLLFKLVLFSASLREHRTAGFPLAQPGLLP